VLVITDATVHAAGIPQRIADSLRAVRDGPARGVLPHRRPLRGRRRGPQPDDDGRHLRRHGLRNAGVHIPHANACPIAGMVEGYRPAGYPQDEPMVPHGSVENW
jgi:hypothetical protein